MTGCTGFNSNFGSCVLRVFEVASLSKIDRGGICSGDKSGECRGDGRGDWRGVDLDELAPPIRGDFAHMPDGERSKLGASSTWWLPVDALVLALIFAGSAIRNQNRFGAGKKEILDPRVSLRHETSNPCARARAALRLGKSSVGGVAKFEFCAQVPLLRRSDAKKTALRLLHDFLRNARRSVTVTQCHCSFH